MRLLLLLAVMSSTAFAGLSTDKPADKPVTPLVIYIGGAKSTATQMACWKHGAEAQAGGKYQFNAYPYPTGVTPDHGSDKEPNGIALVERIAKDISSEDAHRPLIIVGHSSGSDLANALAVKVHGNGRAITRLIDLDGYGIPNSVSHDIPATCVTAHGRDDSGNDLHSLYWPQAHNDCPGREHREMEFAGCGSSKFCLHFRMANKSASRQLDLGNYGAQGYNGCATNLDWLSGQPAQKAEGLPSSTTGT